MFNTITKRYRHLSPMQLVLGGIFMLMLAGAVIGGLATRPSSAALMYENTRPKVTIWGNGCWVTATGAPGMFFESKMNVPVDQGNTITHGKSFTFTEQQRTKTFYWKGKFTNATSSGKVIYRGKVLANKQDAVKADGC